MVLLATTIRPSTSATLRRERKTQTSQNTRCFQFFVTTHLWSILRSTNTSQEIVQRRRSVTVLRVRSLLFNNLAQNNIYGKAYWFSQRCGQTVYRWTWENHDNSKRWEPPTQRYSVTFQKGRIFNFIPFEEVFWNATLFSLEEICCCFGGSCCLKRELTATGKWSYQVLKNSGKFWPDYTVSHRNTWSITGDLCLCNFLTVISTS
jgi:hypothetical protein